jgi:hypothetical protein
MALLPGGGEIVKRLLNGSMILAGRLVALLIDAPFGAFVHQGLRVIERDRKMLNGVGHGFASRDLAGRNGFHRFEAGS